MIGRRTVVVAMSLGACAPSVDVPAVLAKGKQFLGLRQYEKALPCFDQVLQADPSHVEARVLKAEILFNTIQLDAAAALLTALRRERPADVRVAIGLGLVRTEQGRYPDAVRLFESVPPPQRPVLELAKAWSGVGRHDEAARAIAGLLSQDPWRSKVYFLFSKIEGRRGREVQAAAWGELFRSQEQVRAKAGEALARENQGDPGGAAVLRAQARFEQGRWFAAATLLRQVLNAPGGANQPLPLALFGRIAALMGDAKTGADTLQRSLQLHEDAEVRGWLAAARAAPQEPRTPRQMVAHYRATKQPARARAAALFAHGLAPRDPELLRLVLATHDREVDLFVRVWALRRLAALLPNDAAVRAQLQAEQSKV